jgi:hypothetical protein
MGDGHHLHLLELVLAEHARGVAAGAAGLGPEAQGMGGIPAGEVVLVHDVARDDVGQRDLGGGDQPPAVRRLVAVLAEFRQLAGAIHDLGAHEDRAVDLGQAVFLGMDVEHELRQRPVEARDGARHQHEAGARELRGGLEIHAGRDAGQLEMLLRLEVEAPAGCPSGESRRCRPRPRRRGRRHRAGSGCRRGGRGARRPFPWPRPPARRSRPSFRPPARGGARIPPRRPAPWRGPRPWRPRCARPARPRRPGCRRGGPRRGQDLRRHGGEAPAGEGGVEGLRGLADGADVVHGRQSSAGRLRGRLWRSLRRGGRGRVGLAVGTGEARPGDHVGDQRAVGLAEDGGDRDALDAPVAGPPDRSGAPEKPETTGSR